MPPVTWAPAPKPGIVPLRPLLFSEILDGAFRAMRANPRTMIGISAAVIAVTSLVTIPVQAGLQALAGSGIADLEAMSGEEDPFVALEWAVGSVGATLPGLLLLQLATIVLGAMLVVAVSGAVLGERTPPGELWRRVRRRVPAAIGLALLTWLVTVVVVVVGVGVFAVPSVLLFLNDVPAGGAVLAVLAVVASAVLLLALFAFTALAPPALLLEGIGPVAALRRSARLVRSSFWRTLGILVVASVVVNIGSAIIGFPVSIVSAVLDTVLSNPLHTQFWPNVLSATVSAAGQTAAGAVLQPWWVAVVALVYIDLRMRREGLDLELLQAANGSADGGRTA